MPSCELLALLGFLLATAAAWTPSGSVPPCALRHVGERRCGPTTAQTADLACDEESCGDGEPQQRPGLTAPGEGFKQAVYTKGSDGDDAGQAVVDFTYTRRPDVALDYTPLDDRLLEAVVGAAERAVADPDPGGQEAYGDWIREELSAPCTDALTGLRGRKLVWWLDAPRPLGGYFGSLRTVRAAGLSETLVVWRCAKHPFFENKHAQAALRLAICFCGDSG